MVSVCININDKGADRFENSKTKNCINLVMSVYVACVKPFYTFVFAHFLKGCRYFWRAL